VGLGKQENDLLASKLFVELAEGVQLVFNVSLVLAVEVTVTKWRGGAVRRGGERRGREKTYTL